MAAKIVYRWRVETRNGLYWTGEEDFFTDDCLDAEEFETEGEAYEACADLDDVFVERFQRYSAVPKITVYAATAQEIAA